MPQEPNKKIDTLLKGYARERRKEMPVDSEIPSGTRERLQTEISRRNTAEQPLEPKWSKIFWVRASLAASFCIVIGGMVSVIFYSHRSPDETARTSLAESTNFADHTLTATANGTAQRLNLAGGKDVRESEDLKLSLRAPGKGLPENQPLPQAVAPLYREMLKRGEDGANLRIPAIAPGGPAQNFSFEAGQGVLTAGRFTTVPRVDDKSHPATVLTSFDFQRTGPAVQIIDADGSIYAGAMLRPAATRAKLGRTLQLQDRTGLETYYKFQASGTNVTLQQRVSLTGEVLRSDVADSERSAGLKPNSSVMSGGSNALTIQATALVGTTNQFQIKAISGPAH